MCIILVMFMVDPILGTLHGTHWMGCQTIDGPLTHAHIHILVHTRDNFVYLTHILACFWEVRGKQKNSEETQPVCENIQNAIQTVI